MEKEQAKLGLVGLIAIVVGGVIGGGIFNISKLLAEGAALGAILISWIISGTGILSIAFTFILLNASRPDLSQGIYHYARAGFGNYAGFNIAWGYWIGTALSNVVFSVMLNDACGLFFPVLLEHRLPTLIFASCATWFFAGLVALGLKVASVINTVSTIIKFSSLALIIVLLLAFADYDLLKWDFWGRQSRLGSLSRQIDSTLLTTLFFFMGVEGAIVVSYRARRVADVGKATIIGCLICLVLNILVCVLSFGFMTQPEMVKLDDPALAQVVARGIGEWARVFVNLSVIVAVAGAWLVTSIIAAELPTKAASDRILPHFFSRYDKRGTPVGALLITTCFIQLFLFLVVRVHNAYVFFVDLSGIMILPTYIVSALFLVKGSKNRQIYPGRPLWRNLAILTGLLTAFYCFWIIRAGHIRLLLQSSGVYLIGILFYWLTYRQNLSGRTVLFSKGERYVVAGISLAFAAALVWEFKHLF